MVNKNILASNIKKARVSSGMSQKKLAEKLGISFKTVSAYETGRALPPVTSITKISSLTGIGISEIMGVKIDDREKMSKTLQEIKKKLSDEKQNNTASKRTKIDVFVGVVLMDGKKNIYLIKEEDKHRISLGRWNLPGGSVDGKESLLDSIQRETKEETGYNSETKLLLGCYLCKKGKAFWIYVVFGAEIIGNRKSKTDPGVKEGKWFGQKEFLDLENSRIVHPDMKLVYKIAVENRGLPTESVKYIDYDKQ